MSTINITQLEETVEEMGKLEMGKMETKKRATRAYDEDGREENHNQSTRKMTAPQIESRLATRVETRSSEASIGMYQTSSTVSIASTTTTIQTVASEVDFGRDMTRVLCADVFQAKAFMPESFRSLESPANFGVIVPGIFRCSYPRTAANFEFVKALSLKTIVTLVDDELPDGFQDFTTSNGIHHIVIGIKGTKKATIPVDVMRHVLRTVLDQSHHPLLVHCNQGKHRTGCVAGVIKKACGWHSTKVIDEYISYAEPKVREMDIDYLERFDVADLSGLFENTAVAVQAPNLSPFGRFITAVIVCLVIWYWTAQKIGELFVMETD